MAIRLSLRGSRPNPVIILGDVFGHTGCRALVYCCTNNHCTSCNVLILLAAEKSVNWLMWLVRTNCKASWGYGPCLRLLSLIRRPLRDRISDTICRQVRPPGVADGNIMANYMEW